MDLNEAFEILNDLFSYKIESLGNNDGYVVQIWDGYGLRRANAHEGNLQKAIAISLDQYRTQKEH